MNVLTLSLFLLGSYKAYAGSGCADGQREGFISETTFPNVAGCSGAWSIPGLSPFTGVVTTTNCPGLIVQDSSRPACGRLAGDDSVNAAGVGCNVEDLCAEGWHVCYNNEDLVKNSPQGCQGSVPAGQGLLFITRQSSNGCNQCSIGRDTAAHCDSASCAPNCFQTLTTTNDVFGCGNYGAAVGSCGALNQASGNLCANTQFQGWSCDDPASSVDNSGLCEWFTIKNSNPSSGGVLCCRDANSVQDFDNDGVLDFVDNCITVSNPDQQDMDNDGMGDACDNCYDPLHNGVCTVPSCHVNEHVVNHTCAPCPEGLVRAAGDDPSSDDTPCLGANGCPVGQVMKFGQCFNEC